MKCHALTYMWNGLNHPVVVTPKVFGFSVDARSGVNDIARTLLAEWLEW